MEEGAKNPRANTLYICTYNMRSLREDNRIIELEHELDTNSFKLDIIGLVETRRKEIARRIRQGWARFGRYYNILRDIKISISLKRKIMGNIATPAMTYGAETWSLTNKLASKLQVAQRSMERAMLNITRRDSKRNEWVREQTKVLDIIAKAKSLQWKWAGHIGRMAVNRSAKKCMEWTPYKRKRSRGRPKKRWRDEIVEKAGVDWMRRTGKRPGLKTLGRPPACSGLNG